jgi:acetyl/propionyl-CoA carboxylase alpha subunit
VACGERLAFTQEQLVQRGHAIECRLYAEDPAQDFLPATGRIAVLHEPYGPGRRIDSGLALYTEVTPYYDPILAKLVTYGLTRHEALDRMQALLREYTVLGVTTNRQFLLEVVASAAFANAETNTMFLAHHFANWQPNTAVPDAVVAIAALGELLQRRVPPDRSPLAKSMATGETCVTPWQRYDGWRLGGLA